MFYPKIETLFDRDKSTHKVNLGEYRLPEFKMIDKWLVTEKIDGTNIRIELKSGPTVGGISRHVSYHGRTDRAQMPTTLVNWLHEHIPQEKVLDAFDLATRVTIFGEGYGAGIQKGGNYRSDVSFRIFDVVVDDGDWRWWLNWDSVRNIAAKLEVKTVPVFGVDLSMNKAIALVHGLSSVTFAEHKNPETVEQKQEGVVCKTEPIMLQRNGQRIVWKLKRKDFPE